MWRRSDTAEEMRLFWESLLPDLFDKFLDLRRDLGRLDDIWSPDACHFVVAHMKFMMVSSGIPNTILNSRRVLEISG